MADDIFSIRYRFLDKLLVWGLKLFRRSRSHFRFSMFIKFSVRSSVIFHLQFIQEQMSPFAKLLMCGYKKEIQKQ